MDKLREKYSPARGPHTSPRRLGSPRRHAPPLHRLPAGMVLAPLTHSLAPALSPARGRAVSSAGAFKSERLVSPASGKPLAPGFGAGPRRTVDLSHRLASTARVSPTALHGLGHAHMQVSPTALQGLGDAHMRGVEPAPLGGLREVHMQGVGSTPLQVTAHGSASPVRMVAVAQSFSAVPSPLRIPIKRAAASPAASPSKKQHILQQAEAIIRRQVPRVSFNLPSGVETPQVVTRAEYDALVERMAQMEQAHNRLEDAHARLVRELHLMQHPELQKENEW